MHDTGNRVMSGTQESLKVLPINTLYINNNIQHKLQKKYFRNIV